MEHRNILRTSIISLISFITKQTLTFSQNGIFMQPHMEKGHVMVLAEI